MERLLVKRVSAVVEEGRAERTFFNSLIWYRNNVRKIDQPPLEMIRTKLQERLERERLEKEDVPIEDVVGKINPREPDVIQQFFAKANEADEASK